MKAERHFLRDRIIEYHHHKKTELKEAFRQNNSWTYLYAQFSFNCFMEQAYPNDNPMKYFEMAAVDFGFSE